MGERWLVFGGRDYNDAANLNNFLFDLMKERGKPECVIHGGAKGVDRMGGQWARSEGIVPRVFPADWENLDVPGAVAKLNRTTGRMYNVRAGFMRNQDMIDIGRPTLAVEFPGGYGTEDMARRCTVAGIPIVRSFK